MRPILGMVFEHSQEWSEDRESLIVLISRYS